MMKTGRAHPLRLAGILILLLLSVLLCVALGAVVVPINKTATVLWRALTGQAFLMDAQARILLLVRRLRVLSVFLVGAAVSRCGAAMQGLLRNPLADGATLGVSSGASLGAMLALLFGFSLPGFPLGGTALFSMAFAFMALVLVLSFAYVLDRSLATTTIILIGIVLTMLMGSLMSLLISFAGNRLRTLTFWTLGSLSASSYSDALLLAAFLLICVPVLLSQTRELDALSLGEEAAQHLGVSVRKVKLLVLIIVSMLIGVTVSIGGSIGFVGLGIPHITRLITGPKHKVLLPYSLILGGIFLMYCDLIARSLLSPVELPLGVVTSLIGAVFFMVILLRQRRKMA